MGWGVGGKATNHYILLGPGVTECTEIQFIGTQGWNSHTTHLGVLLSSGGVVCVVLSYNLSVLI